MDDTRRPGKVVAAARRATAGDLDLQAIEEQVRELLASTDRITEMATKARTIQSSGKAIEDRATELKQDLDDRLTEVLQALTRREPSEPRGQAPSGE